MCVRVCAYIKKSKGVSLQYTLHCDLRPRSKSKVKGQLQDISQVNEQRAISVAGQRTRHSLYRNPQSLFFPYNVEYTEMYNNNTDMRARA